jgi:hypothetical protein
LNQAKTTKTIWPLADAASAASGQKSNFGKRSSHGKVLQFGDKPPPTSSLEVRTWVKLRKKFAVTPDHSTPTWRTRRPHGAGTGQKSHTNHRLATGGDGCVGCDGCFEKFFRWPTQPP